MKKISIFIFTGFIGLSCEFKAKEAQTDNSSEAIVNPTPLPILAPTPDPTPVPDSTPTPDPKPTEPPIVNCEPDFNNPIVVNNNIPVLRTHFIDENVAFGIGSEKLDDNIMWTVSKTFEGGASWQTIDSIGPYRSGAPTKLLRALPNTLIVAGTVVVTNGDESSYVSIIRISNNGGITWTTTYNEFGFLSDLVKGPAGILYATYFSKGGTNSFLIQSSDAGATWQLLDSFTIPGRVQSVAVNSLGEIFAVVRATVPYGQFATSLIRKSIDGGLTWKNIDLISKEGLPSDIEVAADDRLIVTGTRQYLDVETSMYSLSGQGLPGWPILIGLNSGNTWINTENFRYDLLPQDTRNSTGGAAYLALDPFGNMYLIGGVSKSSGAMNFIRRSTDNGLTWETLYVNSVATYFSGFSITPNGDFYLTSRVFNGGYETSLTKFPCITQ